MRRVLRFFGLIPKEYSPKERYFDEDTTLLCHACAAWRNEAEFRKAMNNVAEFRKYWLPKKGFEATQKWVAKMCDLANERSEELESLNPSQLPPF